MVDQPPTESPGRILQASLTISNVKLPHSDLDSATKLWKVECRNGRVSKLSPLYFQETIIEDANNIDAKGSLMLPSLCHSHLHLDKCFILDRCGIVSGHFKEAMEVTGKAKAAFALDLDDLYRRGARLIHESVECGVTSMRAHVEVDAIVGFACLDVAESLRDKFKMICEVQIAVFAQEPLFDAPGDTTPGPNYTLLLQAIKRDRITVIGSAPYVEPTIEQAKMNIGLIMDAGSKWGNHVDFHLDYNLDPSSEPLIYEVIAQARRNSALWSVGPGDRRHTITVSHATRLQLFSPTQWQDLRNSMDGVPITLVGLPQSDMYMQGRSDHDLPLGPPRSTLRVPYILNNFGIEIAMGVNNIENAFTPQGSLDPLSLCTFGVAIFQSATPADIRTLIRSVTLTSKRAIGENEVYMDLLPTEGGPADFVILHGTETLLSAVLHPSYDRTTIRAGVIVARRTSNRWFLSDRQRLTHY